MAYAKLYALYSNILSLSLYFWVCLTSTHNSLPQSLFLLSYYFPTSIFICRQTRTKSSHVPTLSACWRSVWTSYSFLCLLTIVYICVCVSVLYTCMDVCIYECIIHECMVPLLWFFFPHPIFSRSFYAPRPWWEITSLWSLMTRWSSSSGAYWYIGLLILRGRGKRCVVGCFIGNLTRELNAFWRHLYLLSKKSELLLKVSFFHLSLSLLSLLSLSLLSLSSLSLSLSLFLSLFLSLSFSLSFSLSSLFLSPIYASFVYDTSSFLFSLSIWYGWARDLFFCEAHKHYVMWQNLLYSITLCKCSHIALLPQVAHVYNVRRCPTKL